MKLRNFLKINWGYLLLIMALVIVAVLLTTGCGKSNSSRAGNAASALASVPGADRAAAMVIVRQCTPIGQNGANQLKWATAIMNDTQAHPNGSRHRLWSCAGIPAARQDAAKAALVTDIEHVHWTRKASRQQFYDVTLPQWVITFRGMS